MNKADRSELFVSLVQTHKGILYKVAGLYCKNEQDRKDLVQEIIVQLWRSFDRYDEQYRHSTWIYRIALNVAISFYRKESSRKKIAGPLTEGIIHFSGNDAAEEKDSDLGMLQEVIAGLKELDKALMLLYLEEKSHKEIARIMGISETNVATKINRIKQVLKQKITQLKNE